MQYCYNFSRYREQEWQALGLTVIFLYMFLECAYSLFRIRNLLQGIVCVGGMAFSFGFSLIMLMAYLEIYRKYSISQEGITLSYPFSITVTHTWRELSEIGICKVHYTTRGPVEYLTAIRCVIGEEKNGPKNGHGLWADSYYSIIHFRKIITIIYSEERLAEFKQVCPFEIIDYRGIKRHYHDPL